MTVREFEILIQTYEKQALKTGKQRPLTDAEKVAMNQSIHNIPPEYSEAFRNAEAGNFSQFDSLPLILKTYLGAIKVGQLREKFKNDLSLNNEELKSYLKEHAMDVSLRAGISVEKNSKDEAKRDTAKAFDTFMNTYVMQSTLMPPTEEEKQTLKNSIGDAEANAALAKDLKRQRVLAKTYFLAQLGKYDILDDNGLGKSFDLPLSETLAHGSRTNFILPSGTDTKQVIDAYMGVHDEEEPVIEERTAATHHVKRRAVSKNGLITSETKETRTYSPLKIFGHQYGMDLSVGGIGKKGPNGRVISGNGESGHAYMRIEEGDEKHCASLLLGIEGSAPGKDSALGHSHGASGLSANQSAFFTDKQIIGAKNGGRQVDLSGISSEDLAGLLKDFDEKYAELQKNANTPKGRKNLAMINDKLMGKLMSMDALTNICTTLGIGGENVVGKVYDARYGYLAKVNTFDMDANTLRQNARAKISQEVACDLAEKRFKAADDIYRAVGAVKELICTHEARGFLWRLRHPIMNYRENAKIENLTKRLKTEKEYDPEDIADAMNYPHDSFSMYWGKGLSNDYVTRLFLKQKFENFIGKSTLAPIIKATKKLVNKFYGEVNKSEALKKRMEIETKQMQRDLIGDMLSEEEDLYKEEELYKMDRDYLYHDDLEEDDFEDDDLEEEDPEAEFRKTSPLYTGERQQLHIDILKEFHSDFENTKSEKIENPLGNEKNSEKRI